MYALRAATDDDWPEIGRVADEAAPWAGAANAQWLARRQAFGETGRRRRHYVATHGGGIVGYGAIEEDADTGRYRLFVVTRADRLTGGLGDAILELLMSDLADLGAREVWMREEARDPLTTFATSHGFSETQRFTYEGQEIVVVERRL
ncbi:MAG: hypothetical protein WEC75_03025 [Dehalococcoidia bacterium]